MQRYYYFHHELMYSSNYLFLLKNIFVHIDYFIFHAIHQMIIRFNENGLTQWTLTNERFKF